MAPPYESCNLFSYFFKASTYMHPKLNDRSCKPTLQGCNALFQPIGICFSNIPLVSMIFLDRLWKGFYKIVVRVLNPIQTIWKPIGQVKKLIRMSLQYPISNFFEIFLPILVRVIKPIINHLETVLLSLHKTFLKQFQVMH